RPVSALGTGSAANQQAIAVDELTRANRGAPDEVASAAAAAPRVPNGSAPLAKAPGKASDDDWFEGEARSESAAPPLPDAAPSSNEAVEEEFAEAEVEAQLEPGHDVSGSGRRGGAAADPLGGAIDTK